MTPEKVLKALASKDRRYGPTSFPDIPSGEVTRVVPAAGRRHGPRHRARDGRGRSPVMMRLPPFKYLAPTSVAEAVLMLASEGPGASVVAGGTDLYPNMKRRHQTPKTLVALRRVGELRGVSPTPDGGLRLGPATTLTAIERDPRVRATQPALWTAVRVDQHAAPAQHGHDRRQRAARHALQLLRPELRVAARHQLLHEVRGRHLLGGAGQRPLLGRQLERLRAGADRARRPRAARVAPRRARGPARGALPRGRHLAGWRRSPTRS